FASGGLPSPSRLRELRGPGRPWARLTSLGRRGLRRIGLYSVGGLTLVFVLAILLSRGLGVTTVLYLIAVALVIQGLGRIFSGVAWEAPAWLRGTSVATGLIALALVAIALLVPGLAEVTLAILFALTLLFNGVENVVTALHPTDPRQKVLLKLVLFSALYGLVLINWIDLFGKAVPAYGIWLILTYFAPFGVLVVFQGFEEWPLALCLGLLVSLMNDLGYYFVGNLLFGFHVALLPWIEGQLGFQGAAVVTYFQGGSFSITVYSWMMGASIYARAAVVGLVLYFWWNHPSRLMARPRSSERAAAPG
ncbi:MAG: hypothetical protein ACREDE_09135, partial [Thermoplasmata archaeon]